MRLVSLLVDRRIYLKPGATDMRKSIDTLSVLVEQGMKLNPLDRSCYLFCNKRKDLIKLLYWDDNGFCLWQKKLQVDKYPWPVSEEEVREISNEKLKLLLTGIDFTKEHKPIHFSRVT